MNKRFGVRLLLFLSTMLPICSTSVLASLPTLPSNPLFAALEKGDVNAVHRAEAQLNAGPATRALDDAQLRYDAPVLLRLAIAYENDSFQRGTPGDLLLALRANNLARASALSLGDANTYLKEAIRAKTQLLPALTKSIGGVNTFGNGLDTEDLDGALRKAPKVSVFWKAATETLPFPRVSTMPPANSGPMPFIKIGDHTVAATIVTSAVTFAPVWITTSLGGQKSLGLTLLVKNMGTATATYHGRSYTSKIGLYLAPSVEFGPLVLHDVAVVVMQSDFIPPETVIGMPMLRRFGEVTLGDNQMTLARASGNSCKLGVPLSFASGPDLNGTMHFPASIGNKAVTMDLVSDSSTVFGVRPGFSETISDGTQVDLAVGSWALRYRAVVPSSWTSSQDAVLGGGVLKRNTVTFRFDTPTPSICIAKAAHG
jgi:hypothetical protein